MVSTQGPGALRLLLLLRLQGAEDQLPAPSATPFLLGKQVLPFMRPSVPKLS